MFPRLVRNTGNYLLFDMVTSQKKCILKFASSNFIIKIFLKYVKQILT